MATLMSVVSEHPAPTLRAGPLDPVLTGLLTKDADQRSTVGRARQQLQDVLSGRASVPPPPPPSPAAPRAPQPVPGASVERISGEDLRALASASKELLGSVARDARDQARELADRRKERKERERQSPASGPARSAPEPRRRRRFKRRWVVVPVVVTLAVTVLVLVGVGFLLAAAFGLL
jgi:hypothetical protein